MFDLTGKTALVTGATGGIGGEIAKAMHAAGAHVVLSGTREAALQDLAQVLGERTSAVAANPMVMPPVSWSAVTRMRVSSGCAAAKSTATCTASEKASVS